MEKNTIAVNKDEKNGQYRTINDEILENRSNGEVINKEIGSNIGVINEYVDNEQNPTEANSKTGSNNQTNEDTQQKIDDREVKVQTQEEITDQEKEDGSDQEVKGDKEEEPDQEDELEYAEEPPPDPAAPLNLSDSQERLKPPFELRPEQLAEIEQLWDLYQAYTPAYTDINGYITETELVYMLKSLLLMTYTSEQLQELIEYCVRPPHPQGHITFDQFVKIARIRQRDLPVEDELRAALQILDKGKQGVIDREYMKEVLLKQGHKMHLKQLHNLIKEVDISNDGTIGIEDIVGTMCVDLPTADDTFKSKEEDKESPEG